MLLRQLLKICIDTQRQQHNCMTQVYMSTIKIRKNIRKAICKPKHHSYTKSCVEFLSTSNTSRCDGPLKSSPNWNPLDKDVRPTQNYVARSHTCSELRSNDVGKEVTLCGWIQFSRMDSFITLRDAYGVTQLIARDDLDKVKFAWVFALPFESVIQITGNVVLRPPGMENKKMPTGDIEVVLSDVQLLNKAMPQLPFEVRDFYKVRESLTIQYRYLELRKARMQFNMRFRSHFIRRLREFMYKKGFIEVETPYLFKRTPGGAREFIVPTSLPSRFYALPQSPQQFKQLLMVGGIDKYFQIAKCFRDESARADRQPEFTQLDLELSFTTPDQVQRLVEDTLSHAWPHDLTGSALLTPFPRITYKEALDTYGTDKPDTRFNMKLCDVTDIFKHCEVDRLQEVITSPTARAKCLFVEKSKVVSSRNKLESVVGGILEKLGVTEQLLMYTMERSSDSDLVQSSITKTLPPDAQLEFLSHTNIQPNSIALVIVGEEHVVNTGLGNIRLALADLLEEHGLQVRQRDVFNFLWVTDFPLFLATSDGGVESAHHPFTAPHPQHLDLVHTEPLQVIGQHYDLVLNGIEIGGGSIRIHDVDLQRHILTHVLKQDSESLAHFLMALQCGCPPHGGIALGLDRLLACLCGARSIRDVIAFPKSGDGTDVLSGAPTTLDPEVLDHYHIQVKEDKQKLSDGEKYAEFLKKKSRK